MILSNQHSTFTMHAYVRTIYLLVRGHLHMPVPNGPSATEVVTDQNAAFTQDGSQSTNQVA